MKDLLFNWIIRKYWGENLAGEVMQFVLAYKFKDPQFRLHSFEVEPGVFHLTIYSAYRGKTIAKFTYSIKDEHRNPIINTLK